MGKDDSPSTPRVVGECTTCGIQLRDWSSTHNHLRFHRLSHVPDCITKNTQSKRISCQVCQRSCQTEEVLAYHAYTEHYVNMRSSKTCPFCCHPFTCLEDFLDHLDINDISFNCEICGLKILQEHKYYQHTVYCTKRKNPGLTSVKCKVCGAVTDINRLYDHLTHHSTQLNLSLHLSKNSTSNKRTADPCPPKVGVRIRPFLCEMCNKRFVVYSEFKRHTLSHSKSRSYVCSYCGRSYCQKNSLVVHLYSFHNATPVGDEILPKSDTTQRRCDACGAVGFVSEELLVRHCVMRCSKRTNLQASFAVIIASVAKNLKTGFVDTLHSIPMYPYLKLGLEAWNTPTGVHEYLLGAQQSTNTNKRAHLLTENADTKEESEFTDIQLLAYLTLFQEKHQTEREDEMIRTMSEGVEIEETSQYDQTEEEEGVDEVDEGGGGRGSGEESLNPYLRSTATTTTTSTVSSPPNNSSSPPTTPATAPLNHATLMQHLRGGGGDRRGGDNTQNEGRCQGRDPVDICLVTSTTNTQVTITPAGHHLTNDLNPPKIAESLPHKPSVAEIKARYPGVAVLADVDFSRVPYLLMEMRECMSDRYERAMEAAGITAQDIQRLEVEAQLLREAEPFYLEDYGGTRDATTTSPPSPSLLHRITTQIEEMYGPVTQEPNQGVPQQSFHGKSKEGDCGTKESSLHSKRRRMHPDEDPVTAGGGKDSSTTTRPSRESYTSPSPPTPSKQLLEGLLREAQTLVRKGC